MASDETRIERLSADARERLRVGLFAVSLAQVASELVQNALDADAHSVELLVSIAERSVEVRDDGVGIAQHNFALLGERICKVLPPSDSEAKSEQGGKVVYKGVSSVTRKRGTTVAVRDLFFNVPARKLQISKESCETIKKYLEPVFLVSMGVRFSIVDADSGRKVVALKPVTSHLDMFRQLFGNELVVDAIDRVATISPLKNFAFNTAHPIFLLNIICDASMYDLTFESEKNAVQFENWDTILTLVSSCARDFLSRNQLLALDPHVSLLPAVIEEDEDRVDAMSRDSNALQSPLTRYRPPEAYFGFLRNVKVGAGRGSSWDEGAFAFEDDTRSRKRRLCENVDGVEAMEAQEEGLKERGKMTILITEGLQQTKIQRGLEQSRSAVNKVIPRGKVPQARPSTSQIQDGWEQKVVPGWKNPVFKAPDLPPSVLNILESGTRAQKAGSSYLTTLPTRDVGTIVSASVSKQDLGAMQVVGQVDKKFVAAWYPMRSSESLSCGLAIIDQHAADERVKLEQIWNQTFSGHLIPLDVTKNMAVIGSHGRWKCISDTVRLDPPLQTFVTTHENVGILRYKTIFAQWGIEFSDILDDADTAELALNHSDVAINPQILHSLHVDSSKGCKLLISKVPRVIAGRCIADPNLVRGIVLEHLLRIEEMKSSAFEKRSSLQSDEIVSASLGCPRGILNLLNSKACRYLRPE
ncbi:hypothetical protein BC830DRAFT_1171209 [Chytriomyces sp. MP71]|nr:hypothetical protein BC830DRAFT_1171209 [Chytriomyces sp. MP71]